MKTHVPFKKELKLFIIFCFISHFSYAQQKLDAYFDHLFANQKMMGSVAISINDSILYQKAIGFANAETKRENTIETKFRIASITKTYTSVLILKAIEEQLLQLDTKLNTYYPSIKNAEKITIEQLLKHKSGIFNFTEIEDETLWDKNFIPKRNL